MTARLKKFSVGVVLGYPFTDAYQAVGGIHPTVVVGPAADQFRVSALSAYVVLSPTAGPSPPTPFEGTRRVTMVVT